ncbi:MAG TPA: phosphatidate cytidylyltransferase [Caulobacteraceae bacterium]|nr:phosphatidate cytidylyltransferase [Caulobacteraceae bacterium]
MRRSKNIANASAASAASAPLASSPLARSYHWNDLGVRVLSALVLIPLAAAAVVWGGWLFLLFVAVGAALLSMEWGIISAPTASVRVGGAVMLAVLAGLFAGYLDNFPAALLLLGFGALASALYARMLKVSPLDTAYGAFYVGWPCVVLMWLRKSPDGEGWTLLLFAIAWASDICAYLIGSWLNGPKFWPRFSPNKTWSGFVGGVIAGIAAAVVFSLYAPAVAQALPFLRTLDVGLSPRIAVVVGLIAALATMAGDLWESMLKRRYGVKDAGNLIPGHGGLMDRVDGMMFAVVALAACKLVIGHWGLA